MNNKSLYPDILFHFTQDKTALFNILNSTFNISYAREKIEGKKTVREFAVPMVSFCDLRLSELKFHMSKYGRYGIGLTKDWANRQGLNPVMYINKHCPFTDNFNNALNSIYKKLNKLTENEHFKGISDVNMKIFDAYRYIKNYEGSLKRDDINEDRFRFADEREWRYVPLITEKGIPPFIAKSRIDTSQKKQQFNHLISDHKLHFQPNDIKYLIVENDNEINELIAHLRQAKIHFDSSVIERLSSRILTAEQIESDM